MIESTETLIRCSEVVRDVANDCRLRAAITLTPSLASDWREKAVLLQKVDALLNKIVEVQVKAGDPPSLSAAAMK